MDGSLSPSSPRQESLIGAAGSTCQGLFHNPLLRGRGVVVIKAVSRLTMVSSTFRVLVSLLIAVGMDLQVCSMGDQTVTHGTRCQKPSGL